MRFNPLNPDSIPTEPLPTARATARPAKSPRRARAAAAEPEAGELLARTDLATLKTNPAKGGIEIKFATKPKELILAALQAAWPRWKWSRFGQLWYAKDTPKTRVWAKDFLCGLGGTGLGGTGDSPVVAVASVADTDSPTTASPTSPIKPATPSAPQPTNPAIQRSTNPPLAAVPQVAPMPGMTPLGLPSTVKFRQPVPPVAVVMVDKAPPGGWTEADRVPAHLRQPWARPSTSPAAPAPVKLPPRPRPFAKV